MKVFPNPSNSPAHHTCVLFLGNLTLITAAGTCAHTCLQSFCHIIELQVTATWKGGHILFPLHGLSPTLKSLSLYHFSAPPAELIHLICSFPLLKDLWLHLLPANNDTNANGQDLPVELWPLRGQRARAQGFILVYHMYTLHLTWGMVVELLLEGK